MEDSTPAAKQPSEVVVHRDASVVITIAGSEGLGGVAIPFRDIRLTEAEARQVYSVLRKWYGRGK